MAKGEKRQNFSGKHFFVKIYQSKLPKKEAVLMGKKSVETFFKFTGKNEFFYL